MVSSGTQSKRFISPFVVLFLVGLLIGALLGMFTTQIFSSAPSLAQNGLWLLSFGIAQTAVALFGARLARSAQWNLLAVGQAMAILGLLISGFGLIA